MALYQRGKIWWVRFTTPDGRQVRQSARTSERREAQEYHDRLKAAYWRRDVLKERPRHLWQDAVERWLTEKEGEKVTLSDDKAHLRWVHPYLYGLHLDAIDRALIDRITTARKAEGVRNATVNRLLQVLRAILRRAVNEWEWLDRAPHVRLLAEPKRRVRWLTREEATVLLGELPEHLAEMARFTLATGLRAANVVGLEWSQVDTEHARAWVHADQAKARKPIPVPLNREALAVLERQRGKHAKRVFTYNGQPVLKANTRAWREALIRAEIDNFRWHDLRHTWATWHVQVLSFSLSSRQFPELFCVEGGGLSHIDRPGGIERAGEAMRVSSRRYTDRGRRDCPPVCTPGGRGRRLAFRDGAPG